DNLPLLTPHDQVKFVICGRADYEWAREVLHARALHARCDVLFSPSKSELSPTELADWIVADRLPVRFQMQLHKLRWNDAPGRRRGDDRRRLACICAGSTPFQAHAPPNGGAQPICYPDRTERSPFRGTGR